MNGHPLDRVVHSALMSSRQSHLAVREGGALRMAAGYGVFVAVDDPARTDDVRRLPVPEGKLVSVEALAQSLPEDFRLEKEAVLLQMTLTALKSGKVRDIRIEKLGDADADQMLALATLTEPGPFFANTHRLGDFYGVKEEGRLLAMAGERMKPDGFTEVSGVCVHPDAQGRGLAAAVMRQVIDAIVTRGETAFLHSYDYNDRAIALYEGLGFSVRAPMKMRTLVPL
ncbi:MULTISPECIES: GNAT family N-acetyltransferase [unclassified Brevundimonas]|uniref:GNAT family N-acetyltransferase n=1 Tax=unclassified Brevundimonas TaxID=2622653 RepID=UPI0025BE9046|nr:MULTISPECIES: GNAT family N-acetyltransferase [unclassified Brevundimonas]